MIYAILHLPGENFHTYDGMSLTPTKDKLAIVTAIAIATACIDIA